MFVGGEFRRKCANLGSGLLLFKMWWRYLEMGCFDTCLKEKEEDKWQRREVFLEYNMRTDIGDYRRVYKGG